MNPITSVCWALAQECRADDVLVVGVATPLAAAAAFVAREHLVHDLTIIVGGVVDPPTMDVADLLTDPFAAARTSQVILDQRELLAMLQRGTITLQFVSPAQVDHTGAVNTSRVRTSDASWRLLPGCLALPDTTATVGRLVAYRIDGGDRFVVERVDHVSGIGADAATRAHFGLRGSGVTAIITEAGRREVRAAGLDDATALDPMPSDVVEFVDRTIDRRGILGLETRRHRSEAAARLAALVNDWSDR